MGRNFGAYFYNFNNLIDRIMFINNFSNSFGQTEGLFVLGAGDF